MRHKSIEAKLRHFTKYVSSAYLPSFPPVGIVFNLISCLIIFFPSSCSALMDGLVTPLQDRIEEWKKTANQLDKDHAKG